MTIVIRFDNDNTATGMTLNINSTGAKSVYYNGAAIGTDVIKAGGTYMFVYNGTQYDFIGSKSRALRFGRLYYIL